MMIIVESLYGTRGSCDNGESLYRCGHNGVEIVGICIYGLLHMLHNCYVKVQYTTLFLFV